MIKTEWWYGNVDEDYLRPQPAVLDIERSDDDEVAIHTQTTEENTLSSYYLSCNRAIEMARQLLDAALKL